jgi:hypothetical protein
LNLGSDDKKYVFSIVVGLSPFISEQLSAVTEFALIPVQIFV